MQALNHPNSSTWNFPRGKQIARHNKSATKTTVSLYLSKNLVEKAKKQGLNLSRICEEALSSILSYLEAQNCETSKTESSKFLGEASFQKEGSGAGSSAGMNARLALGRSRVQIPPGPLPIRNYVSDTFLFC